ncbi:hypothetical protein V1511DRAFT_347802 [Dipodascopsis uninucleata]
MICTRSMQLTMKKTARTFKTLEGQLLATQNGQRATISTRCAELDAQMPQFLGASKAILDYVVFCHQEDSLWPLSEPSVLKKRFDEIFEALRYTKALDTIKALRKEQTVDIKFLNQTVDHLKNDKDRADKIRSRMNQLQNDMRQYKEDAAMIHEEMKRVTEESDALFQSSHEFERVLIELEQRMSTRSALIEQMTSLEQTIEIVQDSDDALQAQYEAFEKHMDLQKSELVQIQSDIETKKQMLMRLRAEQSDALVKEGKLNAEADAQKQRIVRRQELAKSISRIYNIAGYDMILDDRQISEFYEKLKQTVRSYQETLKAVKRDSVLEIDKCQKVIQKLKGDKSKFSAQLTMEKDSIKKERGEATKIQNEAQKIATSQEDIEFLQRELQRQEQLLEELVTEFESKKFSEVQNDLDLQISTMERSLEKINDDITTSNKQADMRAKLAILQEELSKKERDIERIISSNCVKFKSLTGGELNPDTIEDIFTSTKEKANDKMKDIIVKKDDISKELSKLDTKITLANDHLKSMREKKEAVLAQYSEIIEGSVDEYNDKILELEDRIGEVADEYSNRRFVERYYDRAIKLANQSHQCALCNRDFDEDENASDDDAVNQMSAKNFIELMKKRIRDLPKSEDELEQEISEMKYDLERLRSLAPQVIFIKESDTLIPKSEKDLEALKSQFNSVRDRLEEATIEESEQKLAISEIENLRYVSDNIRRGLEDLGILKDRIKSVSQEVNGAGVNRTLEDMETERLSITDNISKLRRKLHDLSESKDMIRSRISVQENEVRISRTNLEHAENNMEKKRGLEERIEHIKKEIEGSSVKLNVIETQLASITPEISTQESILNNSRKHFEAQEREAARDAQKIALSLSEFENLQNEISYFLDNIGNNALEVAMAHSYSVSESMKLLIAELEDLSNEASAREKKIMDMKSLERNVSDNIQLRRLRQKIEETEVAIEELQRKNAKLDRKRYDQDMQRLRNKYARLNAEYGGKAGEIKQMDDQMARHEDELRTEFLNVDETYKESLIKLKTLSAANEDLAKYSKALDNAIMRYHSLKMEEINRIIDELWKKTYCGTDVDTILIRSDDENTKGNRSYNYRVCMVKQDAELDMRGRCSAGQKVLASIIIRLALAECFGINCGLIALDEPTTNLDQENIHSLARSLGSIIETRRAQRNFQLIVITHDEDFLRYMNGPAYCDYYFRVSRNERQKSQIERQKISEVM